MIWFVNALRRFACFMAGHDWERGMVEVETEWSTPHLGHFQLVQQRSCKHCPAVDRRDSDADPWRTVK